MSKLADAVRRCAGYLDALADNMLKNDADMLLDECRDPKDVAAELRAALAAGEWELIATAPRDGTEVWVFVAPRDGLRGFQCVCAYHPDAGWCADELREVTHWQPLPAPPQEKP